MEVAKISPDQSKDRQPGKAIMLINEILFKNGYEIKDDFTFAYERTFLKILNFFIEPRQTKTLYILTQIHFSSVWELSKLFQLGYNRDLQRDMNTFEKYGLVRQLREDHVYYEIIKEFWRKEYPNCRKTKPSKIYYVTDAYKKIIDEFSMTVYKKYIWAHDQAQIQKRKSKYERFLRTESARLKKIEQEQKDSIGTCDACQKLVKKTEPYQRFKNLIVHKTCLKNADMEQLRKWTRLNK